MNTPYDLKESALLIAKLVALTRDGKVDWREQKLVAHELGPVTTRYFSGLEGNSEALVWSTDKSVGFKVFEKVSGALLTLPSWGRISNPDVPFDSAPRMSVPERDLVSISIDHEDGPSRGELYVNLMSLLELARRSSDKIEPKIERVKEYLDKLAV